MWLFPGSHCRGGGQAAGPGPPWVCSRVGANSAPRCPGGAAEEERWAGPGRSQQGCCRAGGARPFAHRVSWRGRRGRRVRPKPSLPCALRSASPAGYAREVALPRTHCTPGVAGFRAPRWTSSGANCACTAAPPSPTPPGGWARGAAGPERVKRGVAGRELPHLMTRDRRGAGAGGGAADGCQYPPPLPPPSLHVFKAAGPHRTARLARRRHQ